MDYKIIKYFGFLPGFLFLLFFIFLTLIGGLDYLKNIPTLLFIEAICLFLAPYFISQKHYHIGYIIVLVSTFIFAFQGIFIDKSHMVFYMIISIGICLYFVSYDYFLRNINNT